MNHQRASRGADERTLGAQTAAPSPSPSPASPSSLLGRRRPLWVVQDGGTAAGSFALVLAGYGDAWAAIELQRIHGIAVVRRVMRTGRVR
ncbi:MAG TPA: hypothetical protein VFT29_18425 [Gemmatimonadaceae bacterium]|nr:hypothetical protein [Gemmatimonadaceae bacterium]